MAINRIVKINLDAANANQGIDALEAKLKRLDNAFSSVSTVSSSSFSGITPAAASSGKAVDNATKSLEKYQGTLDNVSRTALQSSNNLTKQERATLNYDTATRKLNKALEEGKIDQDSYNKSIERAETRFNDLSKATSRSGSGLQQYSGYLSNSDRILKELEKDTSILAQTELKYDVAKRKLNQSLENGVISSEDYSSSLKQLDRQQQVSVAQAAKMDKAFRGSFGGASATMGQLGLQAQDVAVQMQMGTSAAIIFAQQGSQILSAFGPMGAILGTVAAGIGLVATMTGDADTNMKDFNASIAELDAVSFDAKGSVQGLGKSIADLSTNNQVQSTADLGAAFFNAANLIEQSGNTIAESINQAANGWTLRDFKDVSDALDNIGLSASEAAKLYQSYLDTSQGSRYLSKQTDQARLVTQELTEMGKALGLSKDETIQFADAALQINGNATADEINAASSSLIGFIKNMQNSTTLTTKQSANLSSLIAELIRTGQSINQLNDFQEKYAVLQERINSNLDSFVSKQAKNNALIGGFGADSDVIGIIDDIIDREEELTNILKTNLEFTEERLQAQLNKDVIDIISNEAIELENIAKAEELIISLQEKGLKLTKDQVSEISELYKKDIYEKTAKSLRAILTEEEKRNKQLSMSAIEYEKMIAKQKSYEIARKAGIKQGTKDWLDVERTLIKVNKEIDQYYDTIQQRQTDEEWDITGLTALRNQIAEIEKEFGANSELAKKQKAMVYSSFFDGAREGLMAAIASGDLSSVGESVGLSISNAISKGVSQSITKDLEDLFSSSMSSKASGLAAGALGAVGGAVVGGALTYLLTGSGTELTDDSGWRQAQQGTGTVLGDIAAQSESIANATDITASATESLVGINRDMLRALQSVQAGISGASTLISRDASNVQFAGFDAPESKFLWAVDSLISNSVLDVLGGGLLSSALGSLLGGSSKVTDSGIQLAGGSLADLQQSVDVDAYQDTKYKKWKYGSSRTRTDFSDVDAGVEAQFAAVFASVAESAFASATAIGLAEDEVSRAIDEFNIATTQISLKDLSAEEQQAQIQAEFSKIFDGLSGEVVPFINEFQQAGEGLGETLARVATQVQVVDEAAYRLGFNAEHQTAEQFAHLSDELIKASGGIESFISGMSDFVDTFAPEEHKFELLTSDMTRSLADVGLAVPATRDEMWQLMQVLDAGTESGRAQIATLLNLTSTADDYYTALDEATEAIKAHTDAMLENAYAILQDQLGLAFSSLIDHIEDKISAIEDRISKKRGILDALNETASVIREENKRRDWNNSQAALSAALITARSTGMLPTDIDSILSGFQSPTADMFGSAIELERARGIAANDIAELQDITQDQLDTDEKMLMQLENSMQIYKDQYNQLVGINDKLLTFEGSLLAFQELIGLNTKEPASGSSVTNDDIRWTIDQAVSRLGSGEEAWNYLYQRAKDYGVSISRIEEFLPGAEAWVKSQGLPMFADGGVFTNSIVDKPTMFNMGVMGEAGPEAIVPLHMGSEGLGIKNYSVPTPIMQSSSSESVANEIKESRKENAMLMQQLLKKTTNIERNTQTIKNIKQEEMAS